ncbi:hypothetical protein MNB_SV-12-411 [hydrothermal vent metagenome]|uniref:Uncharacterized protein n=1 Tax=hydrothermal vent metagenome TaxID=652676 RepID=A0A1W1CMD7_9ZZZZ
MASCKMDCLRWVTSSFWVWIWMIALLILSYSLINFLDGR